MTQHFIDIALIDVATDRQRQEHDIDAHQDLVDSIRDNGLINPITLNTKQDGSGRWDLIAGERRLRAIKDLHDLETPFIYGDATVPVGMIPFNAYLDLSVAEREIIEFEENIKRKDLTWQERAVAVSKIEGMVQRKAAQTGVPFTKAMVTEVVKSANIGSDGPRLHMDLAIARNIDNPAIAGAKTREEAYKALRKAEQDKRYKEEANRIGPTLKTVDYQAHHGDSLDWMGNCPNGSFDVILTDPPYGMGADDFGDSGKSAFGKHFYEDSAEVIQILRDKLPALFYRITKPDAHLYFFCDIDSFQEWKRDFAAFGWNVFRTPLIWYKPTAFRAPWPEHGPQRKYEIILYARKGEKKVTKLYPDVLTHAPDPQLGHQAQKPVSLFIDLLSRSVQPGDTVFDPFCGTGPIFPAAHSLSCRAVGVELDERAFGIALGRVGKLTKGVA